MLAMDSWHKGQDGSVNYEPTEKNSPREDPHAHIHAYDVSGQVGNYKTYDSDPYSQAGALYNIYSEEEKMRLVDTIASRLGSIESHKNKVLETRMFYKADHDYGTRVANAIGLDMDEITKE